MIMSVPRNYTERKRMALGKFLPHVLEILDFVGDDPAAPFYVAFFGADKKLSPTMGALPYYAEVVRELSLRGNPVIAYPLVARPERELVRRRGRTRDSQYYNVLGFQQVLIKDRKVIVMDEHPSVTGSDYSTARRLTTFLNERPDLSIRGFRFYSTHPFREYTMEDIYREQLKKRLADRDNPPMAYDDMDLLSQGLVRAFSKQAGIKSDRISIVETPGGTMESVGLSLHYLEMGKDVDFFTANDAEAASKDMVGFGDRLVGSTVVSVGPPSEIASRLDELKPREGIRGVVHFIGRKQDNR